jgi:hypothetical protein
MKVLDTTRLSQEQLELLAMILRFIKDEMPAEFLGSRMRLSNEEHKKKQDAPVA